MRFSDTYRAAANSQNEELALAVDASVEDLCRAFPGLATGLGLHELDGELEDLRPSALDFAQRTLAADRAKLLSIDPDRLTLSDWADRETMLSQLETADLYFRELRPFAKDPGVANALIVQGALGIVRRKFAPARDRMHLLALRLKEAPRLLEAAKSQLSDPAQLAVNLCLRQLPGSRQFVAELPHAFGGAGTDQEKRELAEAVDRACHAYDDFERFIGEVKERADGDYHLGERQFSALLQAEERISEPPSALLQRGMDELERLRQRFEQAGRRLDPTRPAMETLLRIGDRHGPPERLIDDARHTLDNLRQFCGPLITIPPAPHPEVVETPPYMRAVAAASIDPPGPFEDRATDAFYQITLPDPGWSAQQVQEHMRGFDPLTLRVISVHEVYPGHYVQFLHLRRHGTRAQRAGQSIAFIEGWAHYTEQLVVDEGLLEHDPALELTQLMEALVRVGRYIAAIRIHCEGLSWEDAMRDIFMTSCGLESVAACREAMRGTQDPMYLSYTLGKLEILRLRQDLRKIGKFMDLKAFHDAFLSHGAPPVPVIGRLLREA